MDLEHARPSRALHGVFALALVACGGRYVGVSETDGAAGNSNGGRAPEPSAGRGGRNTGTGGTGAGGTGISMGGVGVGTAGSFVGTAGMATGTGGSSGVPVDTRVSCQAHCEAFARVCPDRDPYACSKTCYSDQIVSKCPETLRENYDCVTAEITEADSCGAALAFASKFCGAVDGWPLDCDDEPCALSVFGDGLGCHAISTCGNTQADLHCVESTGYPLCSCWVDGQKMADFMTGQMSSKIACVDVELQALCLSYAQR